MGIFNFLIKLIEPRIQTQKSEKEASKSFSTISPDNEYSVCYDEVYFNEMKKVEGFSSVEIKSIHLLNKNREIESHKKIYESFFKNRNWVWREYEDWNDICTKMGKYPVLFPIKKTIKNNDINLEYILSTLKIAELKEVLKTEKIQYQEKFKKNELMDTVKKIINIKTNKIVIDKMREIEGIESYDLYELLMRTIQFRATNLHNEKRASKAGVKKYKIDVIHEEDKVFVDLALTKNPNAIPPFFPSDLTMKTPIIKF